MKNNYNSTNFRITGLPSAGKREKLLLLIEKLAYYDWAENFVVTIRKVLSHFIPVVFILVLS